MQFLRTFGFSAGATVAIWAAVAFGLGPAAMATAMILTILEITLSVDNAVVNAKLLGFLSPWWQRFFMTVGILIAVFVVRFALPVVIVALTSGHSLTEVLHLAMDEPEVYARELAEAGPVIASFGGTFLLMVVAGFFLDEAKNIHWIKALEHRLAILGRYDNVAIFALSILAIVMATTSPVDHGERLMVLLGAVCGIALNVGLGIFSAVADGEDHDVVIVVIRKLTGMAAFVMFLRLEVLDASFSFDGVIGAFAISNNIIVIMAGLGAGALWVRSLTVYLVRAGTLAKFRYLDHGAYYAMGALGIIMILKVYEVETPELVTGLIGLVVIALSVVSSVRHRSKVLTPTSG